MKSAVVTILKKELKRFFGDRRMVFTTVLLPGLMIYFLYSFMGSALQSQFFEETDFRPEIAVCALPDTVAALMSQAEIEPIKCQEDGLETYLQDVQTGDIDLLAVFPTDFDVAVAAYDPGSGTAAPNIEIYYNSSLTSSNSAYAIVTGLLEGYETSITNKFDINAGNAVYDLASDEDTAATIFASMLPMLLLIFLFSGCMAVAPEAIAGEKERGTIATLLITPARRSEIALGKILALSIIALLSGISSAAGTILSLPKLMGGVGDAFDGSVYSPSDYLMLGVVVLSTVLLLISVISIISAFAKSVKEAQTYVTPMMIIVMLVGVTAMFGEGAKSELYFYLIPIYNSVQCMVGIFRFEGSMLFMTVGVVSNLLYACAGVFLLTKMFNRERIIFAR